MMDPIKLIWAELRDIRRRLMARQTIGVMPSKSWLTVSIDQGNVLDSGQNGIKHVFTPITSIAGPLDPNTTTSFIDGIGRGTLYVDGTAQPGYVLVLNDSTSSFASALLTGDTVWSPGKVSVQAGAGVSQIMYRLS